MKMNSKGLTILVLGLLLASCASTVSKKEAKMVAEADRPKTQIDSNTPAEEKNLKEKVELSEEQKKVFAEAEDKLKTLVFDAQKAGPESVQFLAGDLFLKATDASIRGDSHTAAFVYKYIAQLYPDDVYVQKKYAIELIRLGELSTSQGILEKMFQKTKQKDEEVGLVLGGVYTALERPSEARAIYVQLLKNNPKSEEACVFLAKSYALEKKFSLAYKQLDQCQKTDSKKGIYAYYKGKVALSEESKSKARQYFEESLKHEKSYYQAALALGLLHEEKEEFEKAAKVYRSFLKESPQNFPILSRMVQILLALGKFDEVIPFAENLSNLDPTDLNLKVRLGILYSDMQRYEDAKRMFADVLGAVPDSDKILYYLAALNQQTGHFDEAIKHFSKINQESTLFEEAQIQIGQILNLMALQAKSEDRKEREETFFRFVAGSNKIGPKLRVELLTLKASYHESLDENIKAIAIMEEVKGMEDRSEEHDYFLATLYEKENQKGKSRELIEQVLKKNPENPHALNFLGYSYVESGESLDVAFKLITKAVQLRPEDGYIRDSLGWYYYKVGQYDKALAELKKAWDTVKTDFVISKHLAVVYGQLKKFELAKQFFLEALKNCKANSERREVLNSLQQFDSIRLPASLMEEAHQDVSLP